MAYGVALQEYRRTGDIQGAARGAVDRMINGRYSVIESDNVAAYVPVEHDPAAVEDTAERMLDREAIEAFDPVETPSGDVAIDDRDVIVRAAKRGTWVTNETGDGLVLMVDYDGFLAPLVNDQGDRYEFKFSAATVERDVYRSGPGMDAPQ